MLASRDYADGGDLPPTNLMRFDLDGGVRVLMRPSGTEAKTKVYLEAIVAVDEIEAVAAARADTLAMLDGLGLHSPRCCSAAERARSSGQAELAIAGVAEPRHDEGDLVEALVDRRGDHPGIESLGAEVLEALGRRQHAHDGDRARVRSRAAANRCG